MSTPGNVFSPTSGSKPAGKAKMVKSAISSTIPVPVLPKGTSVRIRSKFIMNLIALGTSESKSITSWKIYILTYSCAMFPQIEQNLNKEIYTPSPLSQEAINTFIRLYDALDSIPDDYESMAPHECEVAFNGNLLAPGLPYAHQSAQTRHLPMEEDQKIMASHYSLLLFMAGKRIDGDDHSPLTQKRPDALIRKAHLDFQPETLMGSLRFSDSSHSCINSAWQELAEHRYQCFTLFAEFESQGTDIVQDLIFTSMHLLRYSGMSHAKIVHGFLEAYPWARDIPSLRTAISKFDESVISAARFPLTIQPYIKLIYGDKADIFPRKEMEVLISCAVSASQEISPDIVNFYTSDAFTAIVEAFMAERERRGDIRTLTLRATETNLLKKLGLLTPEEEEGSDAEEEE